MNPATPVTTAFTGSTILCAVLLMPPRIPWVRNLGHTRPTCIHHTAQDRSSSATPRSSNSPHRTLGPCAQPLTERVVIPEATHRRRQLAGVPWPDTEPGRSLSRKPAGLPGGGDDHRSPDGTAVEQLREGPSSSSVPAPSETSSASEARISSSGLGGRDRLVKHPGRRATPAAKPFELARAGFRRRSRPAESPRRAPVLPRSAVSSPAPGPGSLRRSTERSSRSPIRTDLAPVPGTQEILVSCRSEITATLPRHRGPRPPSGGRVVNVIAAADL